MRSHFEDAVKDQRTALEEAVTPVPPIVLNDVVCFLLDPDIERDESDTGDPSKEVKEDGETRRRTKRREGEEGIG